MNISRSLKMVGLSAVLLIAVTGCLRTLFDSPPKPVVSIVAGSPYGPAPLTITFDISQSFDSDGEIVSFTFDFGDGTDPIQGTDLTQPIEHTYTSPGDYFASLTVVDNLGRQGSIKIVISVYPPSK
jgi:serine protease